MPSIRAEPCIPVTIRAFAGLWPRRSIVPGGVRGGGPASTAASFIVDFAAIVPRSGTRLVEPEMKDWSRWNGSRHQRNDRRLFQNRNGGRHCCQPPSAPTLDLPVFASLTVRRPSATRSWLTRSGVASGTWSCPKAGSSSFCGPSWIGPLPRRLPPGGAANCVRKTNSSGASSGGPTWNLRSSSSPSGGDRSFRRLPHHLAVAGLPGRRGLPSRSPM